MADFRPNSTLKSRKSGKSSGLSPCKAIERTTYDFAGATTIHGIAYVFDRAIKVLDRLLWLFVVLLGKEKNSN